MNRRNFFKNSILGGLFTTLLTYIGCKNKNNIIDKFSSIDNKFAVSSKKLAESIEKIENNSTLVEANIKDLHKLIENKVIETIKKQQRNGGLLHY